MTKNVPLSENDARVLAILQAQGRRSYADLGTDLGMAAPSVHERVKKLEGKGVIRGYAADVDPAAVEDAIRLSEEKYCSVGAMVKKIARIHTDYEILEETEVSTPERKPEPAVAGVGWPANQAE